MQNTRENKKKSTKHLLVHNYQKDIFISITHAKNLNLNQFEKFSKFISLYSITGIIAKPRVSMEYLKLIIRNYNHIMQT